MASSLKIAIAVSADGREVSGHAGKAANWLVYDCRPGEQPPAPVSLRLAPDQLAHEFRDDGPHPLHGVDVFVAASAGEGFFRHMRKWGAEVLLTGERDPVAALAAILRGEALPDPRFDVTTALCRLRDLFSRH